MPTATNETLCAEHDVLKGDWIDGELKKIGGKKNFNYMFMNENMTFRACSEGLTHETECRVIETVKFDNGVTEHAKIHLYKLSTLLDIEFREINLNDSSQTLDLIIALTSQKYMRPNEQKDSILYGEAMHFEGSPTTAVIILNTGHANMKIDQTMLFSSHYFLHELGHILGLKHPFDENNKKPFPCNFSNEAYGDDAVTTDKTLMAFKLGENKDRSWYRPLDIATLCRIWGANK